MDTTVKLPTKTLILTLAITVIIHSILYVKTMNSHSEILKEMKILQEVNSTNENTKMTSPNNSEAIDYDKIELIVEKKFHEYNKSFEERFEEASSFFGQKTKETFEDISDHLNK